MRKIYIYTLFCCFALISAASFAEDDLGKHRKLFVVDELAVEGNKRVEKAAILEKLAIKVGEKVDNYQINRDIKKIYSLKYFREVEMHQVVKNNKNILLVKVMEKPTVARVIFEGADEVSVDDLKSKIDTREYKILDVSTVKKDVTKILDLYEEKGHYLARVDYEIRKSQKDSVDLVFKIDESEKVRVKRIMFLGNEKIPDEELKKFMQTREESLFSALTNSGNFKEFDFKTDIERLKFYYKTKGYLQVNIGAPNVTVSEDKRWIFITMRVQEGPQFDVNNLYYSGELLFTTDEMKEKTKLKEGDTYSEESLRQDIQALTEMYQDKGYAFANVLRTLKIVPGENKVDIHYSFERGQMAYFGKINIKGNNKTRDKVVRRELRIKEGMKYSGSKLRISKENVNRLGFFEQNTVVFNTVAAEGSDNILDVEISVKERQTGQISVGAGYSSATNGFFQASVSQNNFRGLGQNLNFQLNYADKQQSYNLGFTEPYLMDTRWSAGFDVYKKSSQLVKSFTSDKWGTNLRVGYPLFEYTRFFLSFQHENTNLSDVRNPTVDVDLENGVAASVTGTLRYDHRNNIFEPTDGEYASFSVTRTGFYGDREWLMLSGEGRIYQPIIGDLVLRSRLQAKQLVKTSNQDVPRNDKFQMGGSRNMRGYGNQDIGPQAYLQDRVDGTYEYFNLGGLTSILYQLEFEHPLAKEAGLKWVVFYDAGNVYAEEYNSDDVFRQDYGFGFRWFSPIGVLRFEFGYPIDPKEEYNESGQQFHFDIGQLF